MGALLAAERARRETYWQAIGSAAIAYCSIGSRTPTQTFWEIAYRVSGV
jgi:hypothetical protein